MDEAVRRIVFLYLCNKKYLDKGVTMDINPYPNILKYEELLNSLMRDFKAKIKELDTTEITRTQIYEYLFEYNLYNNVIINPTLFTFIERIEHVKTNSKKSNIYKLILFLLYLHDLEDRKCDIFHKNLTDITGKAGKNVMGFNKILAKGNVCNINESVFNLSYHIDDYENSIFAKKRFENLSFSLTNINKWCFCRKASPKFVYIKNKKREWETINKFCVNLPYLTEASSSTFDNFQIQLLHANNESILEIPHKDFISYCFDAMTGMSSCIIPEFSTLIFTVSFNYIVPGITLLSCQNYCIYFIEYGLAFLNLKRIINNNNRSRQGENPTVSAMIMTCYYNSIETFLVSFQKRVLFYRNNGESSTVSALQSLLYQFDDIKFLNEIITHIESEIEKFSVDLKGYAILNILYLILLNCQFHPHCNILYNIYINSFKPFLQNVHKFLTLGQLPFNPNQFPIQLENMDVSDTTTSRSEIEIRSNKFVLNENLVPFFITGLMRSIVEFSNFSMKLNTKLTNLNTPTFTLLTTPTNLNSILGSFNNISSINDSTFLDPKQTPITYTDLHMSIIDDVLNPLELTLRTYAEEAFKIFILESNYKIYFKLIHSIYLNTDFDFINEIIQSTISDHNFDEYLMNDKFQKLYTRYIGNVDLLKNISFELKLSNEKTRRINNYLDKDFYEIFISFNLPSVCNVFFNQSVMNNYNQIFNFLLAICYIRNVFSHLLIQSVKNNENVSFTCFIFNINYFWNEIGINLHNLITLKCLYEFDEKLSTLKTIESAFNIHNEFLKDVNSILWLNKSSIHIYNALFNIYSECMRFIKLLKSKNKNLHDNDGNMKKIMENIDMLRLSFINDVNEENVFVKL